MAYIKCGVEGPFCRDETAAIDWEECALCGLVQILHIEVRRDAVRDEATKMLVELGESTGAKKLELQRWWWYIDLSGCEIQSANFDCRTKKAALRNARNWAKRLGLAVTGHYIYGQDPEND